MARGKDIALKLGLAEVQVLIAAVIHSFESGSAKSDEQRKTLANAGQKLRSVEKKLLERNNSWLSMTTQTKERPSRRSQRSK
jgi:hypothetical protein